MLNVVCVNQGNYLGRGAEYVNTLASMVGRTLPTEHKFICFTDDPEGLDEGIEVRPLPAGLTGWWAKLYLFSKEAGLDGRVMYFDLDTVIVGSLEQIAEYQGEFAILSDFYRPKGYGSGVMAWEGGTLSHIWEYYDEAGRPNIQGGDQAWIEKIQDNADRWQDLYPGAFVSYKKHAQEWPPADAAVVCFHGEPRPHEYPSAWVEQTWKKGGLAPMVLLPGVNVTRDAVLENVRANAHRKLPWMIGGKAHSRKMIIVGGGPSLKENLGQIRLRAARGAEIWALNGAHDWLIERGIVPDFHLIMDAREANVCFVQKPHKNVTYFICSRCHPAIFEALEGHKVVMWHSLMTGGDGKPDTDLVAALNHGPLCLIGGGGTIGMRALYIGFELGYRSFHLFGLDSSYRDDHHHAYSQPLNDGERVMDVHVLGRVFKCAPWMAQQARNFQEQARILIAQGCSVTAHGDGLIPFIAQNMRKDHVA